YLAVALLLGAVLHADDAERAAVRAKRSDHGLARGRVGPALHLAGEQHRPAGLGDRSGDAFTDPLPVELRGIRESARASHRELADTTETREILGREGPTGEHRGETPDDLILPDDRRHREGVGEAAV